MNECPSCNHEAMGMLKKMTLGPARTVRCKNCNTKLSVPYWTMIIVLPVILIVFLPSIDLWMALLLMTVFLAAMWIFVPLELR